MRWNRGGQLCLSNAGICLEKFCILLFHGWPGGGSNAGQGMKGSCHTKGKAVVNHGEANKQRKGRRSQTWAMFVCLAQVPGAPSLYLYHKEINKCSFETGCCLERFYVCAKATMQLPSAMHEPGAHPLNRHQHHPLSRSLARSCQCNCLPAMLLAPRGHICVLAGEEIILNLVT